VRDPLRLGGTERACVRSHPSTLVRRGAVTPPSNRTKSVGRRPSLRALPSQDRALARNISCADATASPLAEVGGWVEDDKFSRLDRVLVESEGVAVFTFEVRTSEDESGFRSFEEL
jgi:hypothetical protein